MQFTIILIGILLLGVIWLIRKPRKIAPLQFPIMAMAAGVAVTTFSSIDPERSIVAIVSWAVIVVFYLAFTDLDSPIIEYLIGGLLLLLATIGIGQMAVKLISGPVRLNYLELRVSSLLSHANILATFMLLGIVLALKRLQSASDRPGLHQAALLIFYMTLTFTFSRSAWLSLVCGALALIIVSKPARLWIREHPLQTAALIIALLITSPFVLRPILSTSSDIATVVISSSGRREVWLAAWGYFLANPLTGIGPWTFAVLFMPPDSAGFFWGHPHNLYLTTLSEQGLVGFLALASVGAVVAWRLWQGWQAQRPAVHLALALGVIIAVNAAFELVIGAPDLTLVLFLVWNRVYPDFWEPEPSVHRGLTLGYSAMALLMLAAVLLRA